MNLQHEMPSKEGAKSGGRTSLSTLKLRTLTSPILAYAFLLAVVYVLVSGAAFQGFYAKWEMSDDTPAQSINSILDGVAARPYVYRQLLPQLANVIAQTLPESVRHAIEARLIRAQGALRSPSGQGARQEGFILRYRIVYYMTFLCLFLSLFVLRSICLTAGLDEVSASAAPVLFALMVPILQTRGGFFYDLSEVLALSLAARLALSGRWILLLLLAVPATVNKESFFFFCFSLPPLLLLRLSLRGSLAAAAGAALVSGITYFCIHSAYSGNSGASAIFQLFNNIAFYANPLNLLEVDQTYGLPLFRGYSAIVIAWFAILMSYGWRSTPHYIHKHLVLAAIINVPLFLSFCAEGEVRNLSMLYVGTVVLIGGALQRWISLQSFDTRGR